MKGSFITEHSVTKQYTTASSPPPLCKAREETPEGMEKAYPKKAALSLTCIGIEEHRRALTSWSYYMVDPPPPLCKARDETP